MPLITNTIRGSTTQQLRTGTGLLSGVEAGNLEVSLYDGTSSTGTKLGYALSNANAGFYNIATYTHPVQFKTGLFASVASTTGSEYRVHVI